MFLMILASSDVDPKLFLVERSVAGSVKRWKETYFSNQFYRSLQNVYKNCSPGQLPSKLPVATKLPQPELRRQRPSTQARESPSSSPSAQRRQLVPKQPRFPGHLKLDIETMETSWIAFCFYPVSAQTQHFKLGQQCRERLGQRRERVKDERFVFFYSYVHVQRTLQGIMKIQIYCCSQRYVQYRHSTTIHLHESLWHFGKRFVRLRLFK